MARRCICSRLLAHLNEDPRLRTLPLATRMLWLLLAEAMARFEGVLPFSDPRRVSLLVSASETEVETNLETLIGEGLVARDGVCLVVPMLQEAAARSAVARRNGAAGGRPRRGETIEQARARRAQGELLMPIAEKPRETQPAETPTTSSHLVSDTTQSVAREGWQQLAQDAIRIAGLTARRMQWTPAREWLATGISAEGALDVIRGIVEREGFDPARVSSLGYFTRAIEVASKAAPVSGFVPMVVTSYEPSDFERAIQAWKESGYRGQPPHRNQTAA